MWNFKSLQKPLVALFLLCLFPMGALAQSLVKGTVNDEAGEPIIGATVKVQGSNVGAITDFNGNFSVEAASNATLNISYVGYVPQNIKVNGQSNINVTLKEDSKTVLLTVRQPSASVVSELSMVTLLLSTWWMVFRLVQVLIS